MPAAIDPRRWFAAVLWTAVVAIGGRVEGQSVQEVHAYRKGAQFVIEARLDGPPPDGMLLIRQIDLVAAGKPWNDPKTSNLRMRRVAPASFKFTSNALGSTDLEIRAGDSIQVTLLLGGAELPRQSVIVRDGPPAAPTRPAEPATVVAATSVPVPPAAPTELPTSPPPPPTAVPTAIVQAAVPTKVATVAPIATAPAPALSLSTVGAVPSPIATAALDRRTPRPATPAPTAGAPGLAVPTADVSSAGSETVPESAVPPEATPVPSPAEPRAEGPGPLAIAGAAAAAVAALGAIWFLVRRGGGRRGKAGAPGPSRRPALVEDGPTQRIPVKIPAAGDSIAEGDLQVVSPIAHGGLCDIVLARRRGGTERFALKILRPEYQTSGRLSAALIQEGDIISYLNERHPDEIIVKLKGRGSLRDGSTEQPYLLLEYLDAVDLKSFARGKGLPEPECLEVALEVARALCAIHGDGFVHGDISPENILRLNDPDGGRRYRLIDFGDAHRQEAGTKAPEIAGKPAFISPEQARGFLASASSDVYSLGMTLFYLRAGRSAFESHNSLDLLKMHQTQEIAFPEAVSPELRNLIGRMCSKLPSGRLQAGLVVNAVETLLESHSQ